MSIITTCGFECQESVLSELMRHFYAFVFLLLKCLDETWRYHEIFLCEEGVRFASVASSCCATDSMNVVFELAGHVVVDNVLDFIDVEAARGYIGSDQDRAGPSHLELVEDILAHLLRLISVNALHTL